LAELPAAEPEIETQRGSALGIRTDRSADPWFWSHYDDVPNIVLSIVPPEYVQRGRSVVDFGCGDGVATLGMASRVAAKLCGVDLYTTFNHLPAYAQKNLGTASIPANLSFVETKLGEPLPFSGRSVDLIYSWSVFEHVADVPGVLAEMHRVARPGAALFIQVEPLFFGPFGSHLQRLVDQPWAHLLHEEREFLEMAAASDDHVPLAEQDTLYRDHAFEELKRHLLSEYKSLNRIRADELLAAVSNAGFAITSSRLIKAEGVVPDPRLLEKYPLDLLMTNQIVILARRPL
jgi:ubiquinone/menaquinone biosynthesis C-methylase UbiE